MHLLIVLQLGQGSRGQSITAPRAVSCGNTTGARDSACVAHSCGRKVGAGYQVGAQLGLPARGLASPSPEAAWTSSRLAAEVPKERGGSCQSFQSQGKDGRQHREE